MKPIAALLCAAAIVAGACSSGAAYRGTTSLVVKAAIKSDNINYRGDVTCVGNQPPITCNATATDGRPIAATLTKSGGDCVLTVTVGSSQISRNKSPCP